MKNYLSILILSFIFFSACTKDKLELDTVDLVGKWNNDYIVLADGELLPVEEFGVGSHLLFIYYVEQGIEFFDNCRFNMRYTIGGEDLETYSNSEYENFTWQICDGIISLKVAFGLGVTSHIEYRLKYSNPDENTLELTWINENQDQPTWGFKRVE